MTRHGSVTNTAGKLSSLDRGLTILNFVQNCGQTTMSEIAKGLDLPLSTTYRYVEAMTRRGFLMEINGSIAPSERLADRTTGRSTHLYDLAQPTLSFLRHRTELAAALTVRVHTAALCIDVRRAETGVLAYKPGQVLALYAGASATPLLAMAPRDLQRIVVRDMPRKFTDATPSSGELRAALAQIREDGFHCSRGWLTPGMTAVGVPVMTYGRCCCALSVIGPDQRIGDPNALAEQLKKAASDLANRIVQADGTSWLSPDGHPTEDRRYSPGEPKA
jgi:DNA-binding IclR family transcriptional regulator